MNILVEREAEAQGLRGLLDRMEADPAVGSVLVLAVDGNGWTPEDVDDILKRAGKPVFGGVFPQVLHGAERMEKGIVALGLPVAVQVATIGGLSDPDTDFESSVNEAFPDALEAGTMFVLVDGFSRRISALIDALFNNFGLSINYLGGGGGSLSLVQKPCVITPDGLKQDVALLAYTDTPSGIGVAHGWQPIAGACRVTEAAGNVVVSLDWRPAFDVYREIVESHTSQRFTGDNFFSIAKAYPLGIAKLGTEVIVRDPIMADGGKLVCVGEVPTGAFVHVLNGNRDTLVAAAGQARSNAVASMDGRRPEMELFVDCISRVLFLENEFGLEMEAARLPGLPMVGVLSIGEIANSGQDYLEFYNKTSVVALI
ncbi:MAG TPA: FIST N-terminal domain-containing protein [Thiobacillaceae bacterium]|nr:FIST N-terminal domain-containing protein [Thiobacillaceae bacterium]